MVDGKNDAWLLMLNNFRQASHHPRHAHLWTALQNLSIYSVTHPLLRQSISRISSRDTVPFFHAPIATLAADDRLPVGAERCVVAEPLMRQSLDDPATPLQLYSIQAHAQWSVKGTS